MHGIDEGELEIGPCGYYASSLLYRVRDMSIQESYNKTVLVDLEGMQEYVSNGSVIFSPFNSLTYTPWIRCIQVAMDC